MKTTPRLKVGVGWGWLYNRMLCVHFRNDVIEKLFIEKKNDIVGEYLIREKGLKSNIKWKKGY